MISAVRPPQSEPYKVFDTKPVITEGPYLVGLSDTAVSIVWMTDTPSHSRIKFGVKLGAGSGAGTDLAEVSEPSVDGLVPVGLRHVVTLRGLKPGTLYQYQAVSTRVGQLKAYWPDKGLSTESRVATFTTFDPRKATASFSAITDTHEDVTRINKLMKMVDWPTTDALVHLGDAFDWIDTEGNHELRGPFARSLSDYVPTPEGRFYFARDLGPVHLMVLDTAEDKPDDTNVYAELNRTAAYRAEELAGWRSHVRDTPRVAAAPFRVIAVHQPRWGWLAQGPAEWLALANTAKVDLMIAGHNHRFSYEPPNSEHAYHLVVVGQDQVARVDATATELKVAVTGTDGVIVKTLVIPKR